MKTGFWRLKKNAFTLAELLVAILIISIILTLFAPVLTKRVKERANISYKTEGQLFLYDKFATDCSAAADDPNAVDCKFTVPNRVSSISAVMVSGGGGGAGATTPTVSLDQKSYAANSSIGSSQTKTIKITKNMKNVTISYLAGGGGGGGGGAYTQQQGAPQSQADCNKYNAMFIPASMNGSGGKNTCVTKYNVGDPNGPTMASTVTKLTAGSGTCPSSSTNCCWSGTTSSNCTNSGTWGTHSSNYSGCTRTVCQWTAARDSCAQWNPEGTNAGDWRLPTNAEMTGWQAVINAESSVNNAKLSKYLGSDGLQLCDCNSSALGSPRCHCGVNLCRDATGKSCCAHAYYTNTTTEGRVAIYSMEGSKLILASATELTRAFSVAVSWRNWLYALTLSPAAEAAALLT